MLTLQSRRSRRRCLCVHFDSFFFSLFFSLQRRYKSNSQFAGKKQRNEELLHRLKAPNLIDNARDHFDADCDILNTETSISTISSRLLVGRVKYDFK